MRWTVRKKLYGSTGFVIALVAVTSLFIISQMREFRADLTGFKEQHHEVKLAKDLQLDIAMVWQYITDAALTKKRSVLEKETRASLDGANGKIEKLIAINGAQKQVDVVKRLERLRGHLSNMHGTGLRMANAYFADARRGNALMDDFDRISEASLQEVDAIVRQIEQDADGAYQEMQGMVDRTIDLVIVVFIGLILVSIALVSVVIHQITRPLGQMAQMADAIAQGHLGQVVEYRSSDEIGQLADSFRKMIAYLKEVISDILEAVNVLGASGKEIQTATNQVAAATAETATAVNETTTTAEELKQTTQLSSLKAKHVMETAQKTLQVSQTGSQAVGQMVQSMGQIKAQMETIAESIVRLSEQSQSIGEIIATVDDLAEQSNLLAVNAAIEAAKAGEQGRGFAVVALEMRKLAEQSKQATGQVRGILNDIQKASNKAVLVTEQGGKAVDAGVKLAQSSGDSIGALTAGIEASSQAATQISASSQQQVIGMDQVTLAMENIKQASAQNAASTKEVEAAAISLNEIGTKLKVIVERFRL